MRAPTFSPCSPCKPEAGVISENARAHRFSENVFIHFRVTVSSNSTLKSSSYGRLNKGSSAYKCITIEALFEAVHKLTQNVFFKFDGMWRWLQPWSFLSILAHWCFQPEPWRLFKTAKLDYENLGLWNVRTKSHPDAANNVILKRFGSKFSKLLPKNFSLCLIRTTIGANILGKLWNWEDEGKKRIHIF